MVIGALGYEHRPSLPDTSDFSFCRCLHIINDSRHALGDSSTILDILTDSSGKRRKVMLNSSTISEERLSGSLNQSNETLPSFEDTGNYDYGYKPQRVGVESLKKSKNCLHSLKTSLENLHRENLFPYNPKVLIKRYACLHDALLSKILTLVLIIYQKILCLC